MRRAIRVFAGVFLAALVQSSGNAQQLPKETAGASAVATPGVGPSLHAIESALTRLSGVNPNTFPPTTLNDRLGALSGAVAQADARPTRQMYAVFDELSAAVTDQERRFGDLAKRLSSSQQR
jgi:hypothetical protein